ncbi:galactitol-1-phosphate 5-dehydrogenase [Clostridium sediminicola]|uniref:zinc-dependent alcohol dehydrogenase n=1 Tax=Clostridium sediminicola TaxID=3114879 RepID=UPI0031F1F4B8
MKAMRFLEPNKFSYDEVPTPEIKDDEILARVKAVGICGSDLELLEGEMPHQKNGFTTFPLIPGHEWSGEVVKVGKDVIGFEVGDRVVGDVSLGCGKCDYCREGKFNLCPNRVVTGSYRNKDGAYAEYINIPSRHAYKIPENLSYDEAALIEPTATSYYGVKRGRVTFGETVLCIGDGPIGLMAAQCSKAAGASRVLVVGSWNEKLEIAKELGADDVFNYHDGSISEWVKSVTDGKGVDVVIESSGSSSTVDESLLSLKPGGRIVLLSLYWNYSFETRINDIILKDCDVIGVLASRNTFRPTLAMMGNGTIKAKPLITHHHKLEDFGDALKIIKERKEMRLKMLLHP